MSPEDAYVIWSYEHDAWWAPDRRGYTRNLLEAGRYSLADAEQIVKDANVVTIEEVAVSFRDAITRPFFTVREIAFLAEYQALSPDQRTLVDDFIREL